MMRIGMFTYGWGYYSTGITKYAISLFDQIKHIDQIEVVRIATSRNQITDESKATSVHYLPGCRLLPGYVSIGSITSSLLAKYLRLDILHDPTGVTPFLFGGGPAKTVVTVHDVFAWSYPGVSTLADTVIYRYWLPYVLPRVDAVITVSEVSKADIVKHLRISPNNVRVVYEGVSDHYQPASAIEVAVARTHHNLPERYLLFVGSVEKRKNLHGLLEACSRLWRAGESRPLVVVGARRWKFSEILDTIERLDLHDHVRFTGFVPEADLPALYSGADLFVFPSLYEGFGLPPLEAMACGTPVVCSNAASLPEVVGDAAITVDPHDTEALADAIRRVLDDPALQETLRAKGLARAKQFTWEKAARETLAVYRKVLQA